MSIRKLFGTILFFLTAGFLFLFISGNSQAVTVAPAKIEYKADPGQIITGRLFIVNENQEPRTFYAVFEKFTVENGQTKFLPSEPAELSQWLKMEQSVNLKAGEQKEIPFTIEVPKNAPPGGHFAVIWWGTGPPPGANKQVSIVTRAGILVLLQVSGQVNEAGEVAEFSLPKGKFFFFKLPENFVINFKNAGNTYLKPAGELVIKNIFGSKITVFNVNSKEKIVFPAESQNLDAAKKFDKTPFAIGFYKTELALQWGEKQNNFQQTLYFFVFPWKTVLLAAIILVGLLLLTTKGVKKYNRWILEKYSSDKKPANSRRSKIRGE